LALAEFCQALLSPRWPNFRAEAGIVNFYPEGSSLCGHQDDAEPYRDAPVVSLSLGCTAIFLVGGTTRDELPTALLLRSGDCLLLSGASRLAYHGVPRILENTCPQALQQRLPPLLASYLATSRINLNVRQVDEPAKESRRVADEA
jgi:alkylated DNA repair protein alkB family protein 1